jgi:hypothetical protein
LLHLAAAASHNQNGVFKHHQAKVLDVALPASDLIASHSTSAVPYLDNVAPSAQYAFIVQKTPSLAAAA